MIASPEMLLAVVSVPPYLGKSVLAVICVTGQCGLITQNGDGYHRRRKVDWRIKLAIAILSRSKELPRLTPRPHTAATQAAGRAISNLENSLRHSVIETLDSMTK